MANINYNKVIIGGRLTAAPELKQTSNGTPVCSFGVAVNRRAKAGEQAVADFFQVTAWRTAAELVVKYFTKGSSILVTGTLQNRTWTDANGQKRFATDIMADEIGFVDSKAESTAYMSGVTAPTPPMPAQDPSFEELKPDDDLPF